MGLTPHPLDLQTLDTILSACPSNGGNIDISVDPLLTEISERCIHNGGMPPGSILPQLQKLRKCISIFPEWSSWSEPQQAAAQMLRGYAAEPAASLKRKRGDFLFNPRKSAKGHMTQREIDEGLRAKWADKLIELVLPWKSHFEHMVNTPTSQATVGTASYRPLLGTARAATIKSHCKALSSVLLLAPDVLPLSEKSVANWLQRVQYAPEATPHKLVKSWRALDFIAEKLGSRKPSDSTALKNRFEYLAEQLADTEVRPGRKAKPFGKSVLNALEKSARCAPRWTDRVAASFFRWMAGSSPRYNDTCHAKPSSMVSSNQTLEFVAWQTKVKKRTSTHKPQPMVTAKVAFWDGVVNGRTAKKASDGWTTCLPQDKMEHAWWTPLEEFTKLRNKAAATESADDFMLPAPSKHRERFTPRPCGNGQALQWLRALLKESEMVEASVISEVTLSSFRVFLSNLAHAINISRERRQWLGKWAEESMADTYTRQHRQVVMGIMREIMEKVAQNPSVIDEAAANPVPADLEHEHWKGDGAQLEEPKSSFQKVPDLENDIPEPEQKTKRHWSDVPTTEGGPFWLGYNRNKTGDPLLHRLHIFNTDCVAVGCKWKPQPDQYFLFFEKDFDHLVYKCCHFCWREFEKPEEWENRRDMNSDVDMDSEDLGDSEEEEFTTHAFDEPIRCVN